MITFFFFFSSRRRHTRFDCDWSSDVCSSDLGLDIAVDWYRIAIHDRIVLTENFGVNENCDPIYAVKDILDNAGDVGLQAARFFTNGVDTLTQGADVVTSYRVPWQR